MPPVLRSALIQKLGLKLLTAGVAPNAASRSHDMSSLWSRKGGGGTHLFETSRRTLFELHAGRQNRQLPSKLLLDDMSPVIEPRSLLHFDTSEDLIAALGPVGLEYTVDPLDLIGKLNLSYVKDPKLRILDWAGAIEEAKEAEIEAKAMRKKYVDQINLKYLLIQYLRHVDPIIKYQDRSKNTNLTDQRLDNALLNLFNHENTHYLTFGGRDITDLMNWTWILTSETTERAATRLLAIARQGFINARDRWSIPLFVSTLLLRRRNSSADALRSLLTYAWEMTEKAETSLGPWPPEEKLVKEALQGGNLTNGYIIKNPEDHRKGIRETVFMIMVIRLLRSARKVLPAACDSIVALITRYLDGLNFRKGASQTTKLTSEDTARLTYMYNTLLKLVSLPASIGPYQSAFHQQQAQFSLLRRMNKFQPPLIVDRRGYRAVVSMQLRHKRTLKEREWALMKARSWPPWKEEKLGIDADIGVEHGTSRAMEALRRSWEAGYAPDSWDAVASVLSGWDTDKSPTIQTRADHKPNGPRGKKAKIWASRIRATRTLNEAWSCFLSYKDREARPVGASWVYHQMFEKIAQDVKRPPAENAGPTSISHTDKQQPLPGDGIEVVAAPESPREAIYVRIPPPTLDEFVEMMVKDEIKPGEMFLNTMLRYAPTIEIGLKHLDISTIPRDLVRVLSDRRTPSNPEDQALLQSVSPYVFSSFIRLLTRFSPRMSFKPGSNKLALVQTASILDSAVESQNSGQLDTLHSPSYSEQSLELAASPRPDFRNPLLEAIELLVARKPKYRPAWYSLLRALARRDAVIDVVSRVVDQNYQDIKAWQMTCRLLNDMFDIDLSLDLDGFHILCTGLEKAIFASQRLSRLSRSLHTRGTKGPSDNMRSYVGQILSTGLPLLKELFKDTVRSKSMQQEIPVSLMEEKSRIDESIEEHGLSESDDNEDDNRHKHKTEPKAFLPPGCLLPTLLEVPTPACLHAFIRVLGHCRDYDGLLDLVEWMSLFADEFNAVVDSSANGNKLMRRCLTAIHVFMERSWIILEKREAVFQGEDPSTVRDELEMKAEPAPAGIVKAIKDIVSQNKKWGAWPEPHNVIEYCANGEFI